MLIGAFFAVGCVGLGTLQVDEPGQPRNHALIIGCLLFAAVAGSLIGFFLALKDLVQERLSSGQRVNLLLRAYFAWGLGSLLLWSVTLFAAGIGSIILIGFIGSSGLAD